MPDTFLADFLVGVDFKPTLTRSVIFLYLTRYVL